LAGVVASQVSWSDHNILMIVLLYAKLTDWLIVFDREIVT